MAGTSGRILKSEDIILDGQYHLDMGRSEKDRDEAPQKNTVSAPTRVCILEDHPEYAVLEVTCACGTQIHLRCEYTHAKGPDTTAEAT
jgi:hypothetical protein